MFSYNTIYTYRWWLYLVLCIQLVYIFIRPIYYSRYYNYSIDEAKVSVEYGFIIVKKGSIPIHQIQYISTTANPLLNKLKLLKVSLTTSSGARNIRFLPSGEAAVIEEKIIKILSNRYGIQLNNEETINDE